MEQLISFLDEARKAIEGPIGPRCKSQIVRRLYSIILKFRADGASYQQLASQLNTVGGNYGLRFSADELRGVFGRLRRKTLLSGTKKLVEDSMPNLTTISIVSIKSDASIIEDLNPKRQNTGSSILDLARRTAATRAKIKEITNDK